MSRIFRKPSPALIVAVVALVAALAGTAIAAPGASTSAITKAKVKKIANKQINKVFPVDAGELGDAAVTAPKVAAINTRESTIEVAAGTYAETTATCQTGEKVLSGGALWDNGGPGEFTPILESYKQGNGWYVRVQNGFGTNRRLTVEAYCLAA